MGARRRPRLASQVIYRTNLRTSYAAGRYAQLQAVKATRPYWGYHHSDAVEHPREQHLAWDGLIIHADNPWWQTHYPPSGFGCECGVTAYSLDEILAMGKSGPDEPPAERMRNIFFHGQTVQVPEASIRAGIMRQVVLPSRTRCSSPWRRPLPCRLRQQHA